MTSTEPTTQDSQALCPKCKGKLTSPDQPCPWCVITASPTIPASRAKKRISGLEWLLCIGGTLLMGATLFIPTPEDAIEALAHQWFTTIMATSGTALLIVAVVKYVKRDE